MKRKLFASLWIFLCSLIFCTVNNNKIYAEQNNFPPLELTIVPCYGAGFFAEMLRVIDNSLHFSKENLKSVYVDWSDEFFPYKDDPHENGWDLYFEPIIFSDDLYDKDKAIKGIEGGFYHEIHDFLCIDQWMNYDKHLLYRLKIHEFIKKHIKIKPHIAKKVNQFVEQKMQNYYCIGAHIRYGSDHGSEAPKGTPTLQDYLTEIKELLDGQDKNCVRIYLATDSHYVVQEFKINFSPEILLTIDTFRTEYRGVPHIVYGSGDYWLNHKKEFHLKKPGYYGGMGVLIDALLLAECDIFLHSTSNVSSFVSFYNPYIQSIYLPKTSGTWPCRFGK